MKKVPRVFCLRRNPGSAWNYRKTTSLFLPTRFFLGSMQVVFVHVEQPEGLKPTEKLRAINRHVFQLFFRDLAKKVEKDLS